MLSIVSRAEVCGGRGFSHLRRRHKPARCVKGAARVGARLRVGARGARLARGAARLARGAARRTVT